MPNEAQTIPTAELDEISAGQHVDYRLLQRFELMKRRNESKYGADKVDRGSLGRATSNPNVTKDVIYPYQFDRPIM